MRLHIDRGGTFTDVVREGDDGRVSLSKVPSDEAVIGTLADGAAGLTFGTTVATNALLEARGVPTLLVVTEGFEDLVRLRDMARPELFAPDRDFPPSLATEVIGVAGRMRPDGSERDPLGALPAIDLSRFSAIAIALVGAGEEPAHELALERLLGARAPHAYITSGHRVSRDKGYLARIETTLVDAAVTPILRRALAADRIPEGALAMRSDGSLLPARDLRAHEAVLSGPAGGVLATVACARQGGFERAVGLDMGGTSTDVCVVDAARDLPLREGDLEVAGVRLRRAMLEVETIAAGGGSILSAGPLGLAVGPRSAGADPGPQCYGRGGPPTLTDAALSVGLIDPSAFPFRLHPEAIALPGEATSFLAIAREAMAQAVRRLAMARGVDLADHALVSYGGAGGQHAAPVAELLGIRTVLVHPAASVFCAFGQTLARRTESVKRPLWGPLGERFGELAARLEELSAALPSGPGWLAPEHLVALRHVGTDHALEVTWSPASTLADLEGAFSAAHHARHGFSRALGLEVAGLEVRVRSATPRAPECDADPFALGAHEILGPAVLSGGSTSVLVPEGWRAALRDGLLRLDRLGPTSPEAASDGPQLELWQHRLAAIAAEAGVVLARLARSVSIKERHDFSCALFDARGRLVTNAPHIPVHLGAMGDTVRDLVAHLDAAGAQPDDGDAWLCNDPSAGGSHLPDLTVITLVRAAHQRFFVASRGHHVDVGGLTPGSMPVASRTLADEGLRFARAPLVTRGRLADLGTLLAGSRQPDVVAADLEAQLAANAHMARRLRQSADPAVLTHWMHALHEHARAATERLIASLPLADGVPARARDDLAGVPLQLRLERRGHRLVVDLSGTGGPHEGNLNAPGAVVRAAILYALRVLVDQPLPLCDGTLAPIELVLPRPSIVAPPPESAVVGGNVETSQRLVDLFFTALGVRAASAGTMNNLVIGRSERDLDPTPWAFYETLGGGLGATATRAGRSGRQLHMTNTRATDPEILEARLPLLVRRFALRRGSGGAGQHPGGDGLVRELEVTRPASASLLAAWREAGAPGLEGGAAGAPGRAWVVLGGVLHPWRGQPIELAPGDRVIVETPGGGGWGTPPMAAEPPPNTLSSKDLA